MINLRSLWLVLIVTLTACGESESPVVQAPPVQSNQGQTAAQACTALAASAPADTTINTAEVVAAGTFVAPTPNPFGPEPDFSGLPEFCRLAGSIAPTSDSDIRFELWLPVEGWNGFFMQTGNGGAAGALAYGSLLQPLNRGYAVAHTDTGHRGGGGDFSWAPDHPERMVDYQYRAVRELTIAGKHLTEQYYGRVPERAYWMGCSTGGRQGLKEVQRFAGDYDAVIAGAPANNWSPLMMLSMVIERELDRVPSLVPKLGLLHAAAIAACDQSDGVADRVITTPESCGFDPGSVQCGTGETTNCLTENEVAAARTIYAGVVNSEGDTLMPGTGPGSEMEWAAYASPGFRIGSNYFSHLVAEDPDWTLANLDVDRDLALAEAYDRDAAKAMDANIQAFVEAGGKLLLYHGTTDGLIPYANTVNYYNSVTAALGQDLADQHVQLFLVPGMAHCSRGNGVYEIDWLGAMEKWVEQGQVPEVLAGSHPGSADGRPGFSRPVCSYPSEPRYDGAGEVDLASSFQCLTEGN